MNRLKVVFICSSLEPGRDGIGDYTRRLAGELNRQGYFAGIIALFDRQLQEDFEEGIQYSENTPIHTLRLSAALSWKQRIAMSLNFVELHNPEWLSLQYVPYGFQDKGLPFNLPSHLKLLGVQKKWHIMFHETWIGITKKSPLKHKIYGFFQILIAKYLIYEIKPKYLHTSNKLHQIVLRNKGIDSVILSLFNNIPFAEINISFIRDVYNRLEIFQEDSDKYIYIGVFGTIYPEAKIESVLKNELHQVEKINKQLVFIALGKSGSMEEYERIKKVFSTTIKFIHLGMLSEVEISSIFQILDKAISCTPEEHIGKSSVYASMRFHGIPVVFSSSNFLPEYDKEIKEYNEFLKNRPPHEWDIKFVSEQLLEALTNN